MKDIGMDLGRGDANGHPEKLDVGERCHWDWRRLSIVVDHREIDIRMRIFVEREKKNPVWERYGKRPLVGHFEAVITVGKCEKSGRKKQKNHSTGPI
jgi:hypothetical protein